MNTRDFRDQADLVRYIEDRLDGNEWEICRSPTAEETLDFVLEESGVSGLPGDEDGEVVEASLYDVEPLEEEDLRVDLAGSDELTRIEERLVSLSTKLSDLQVSPVRLRRGIGGIGDLVRDCFKVSARKKDESVACYIRETGEGGLSGILCL